MTGAETPPLTGCWKAGKSRACPPYVEMPMANLLLLLIAFVYVAVAWVVVLSLYNFFMEPFDFGPIGMFALKSTILVTAVALFVAFVPLGLLASLIVWWVGLMLLFKKALGMQGSKEKMSQKPGTNQV